ncbi:hypothetical protein Acr_19g0001340 [Actinidia rufa]|uniref:GATA transcription factor 16 n=1 Tax=Actinidia rufa TaxID=165716 RepID=A0A7J0G8R3_9ERIC|nr:hypothetical protein Acr_19g0001340 [Actinidia rufa]
MNEVKKCCADCKTTKTPLWSVEGGSSWAQEGQRRGKRKPATTTPTQKISSDGSGKGGNLSEDLRVKLMDLGKEMVRLQRQRSPMKRRKTNSRNLGEEEQAAFLLMALSCGSVFA